MLRAILLILNYSLIFASYTPVSTSEEIDTFKDEALVQLAYSDSLHDNVGELYRYITNHITGITLGYSYGSTTYIGGKTCFTSAHCEQQLFKFSLEPVTVHYEVVFEINGQKKKPYKATQFICYPQYKQNHKYDLAILILEEPVAELKEFKISEEFSNSQTYENYQHLLTYIGYGVKVFDNNYFLMEDNKRRALRAYTQECSLRANDLGIYSTPYGQYNRSKASRPLEDYEVGSREGMSGGAVININHELVGIIRGTQFPNQFSWQQSIYNAIASVINIVPLSIDACCYPMPYFASFPATSSPGTRTRSIPLAPFKTWIDGIRQQYDDTYLADRV